MNEWMNEWLPGVGDQDVGDGGGCVRRVLAALPGVLRRKHGLPTDQPVGGGNDGGGEKGKGEKKGEGYRMIEGTCYVVNIVLYPPITQ